MILSDIRKYIEQRGQVTLADMANHFESDPEALRGMLNVWIRKGKITRHLCTSACGSSCKGCDSAATEIYIWGSTPDRSQQTDKTVKIVDIKSLRPL
ncbi:MAG: FeoC-like transcriptional regulator [Thiohalomonadales bacterium]|nr:FeoC-like transcriptional regulator [Thiohalomonadales bacterium]